MIQAVEGRLGGGKTITVLRWMLTAWMSDKTVATNVDVVWPEVKKYCLEKGYILDDKQFIRLEDSNMKDFVSHIPADCLCVFDEIHLWFNARAWKDTQQKLLDFLTQSRKVAVDVVFITQHIGNMDKQFLRLVQYIWRIRNLSTFIVPGFGFRWPFKQLLVVQYDYDGKTRMDQNVVALDSRLFSLYRTNAIYSKSWELLTVERGHCRRVAVNPLLVWARWLWVLFLTSLVYCVSSFLH